MTARTLVRAWKTVGALVVALFLTLVLAVLTHSTVINSIGPFVLMLLILAIPTALVMTVIRAISMSVQRRRREQALLSHFHAAGGGAESR